MGVSVGGIWGVYIGMAVQSVHFLASHWTEAAAVEWLHDNGIEGQRLVPKRGGEHCYRLFEPDAKLYRYRMKVVPGWHIRYVIQSPR